MLVSDNVWQILSEYFWSKLKALKDQRSTWIQGLTIAGSWKSNPYLLSLIHRVVRELSFFSSRRNWDSPNPSPAGECAPTALVPGGGAHSLARKGVVESQFQRGYINCGTLYIYELCALIPSGSGVYILASSSIPWILPVAT